MPEQLMRVYQPVKDKWDALTQQQKRRVAGTILIVLVALILSVVFLTRTKYVTMFKNRTAVEIGEVANALGEAGIKYKIINSSTGIAVDEKQLNRARIEIETRNALNDSMFTYEDALKYSGMGTTESQKRTMERRAAQTDLSNLLSGMFDGVTAARVTLVLPNENSFMRGQGTASASVIINTSRRLDRSDGEAIARIVCRSVEGLDMERIEVTDQNFNTIYSGMNSDNDSAMSVQDFQDRDKRDIVRSVSALFGMAFDDVQVAANLRYSNEYTSTYLKELRPPVQGETRGVPLHEYSRSMSAEGINLGDEPGLGSNDQVAPTYETGDNTHSSARSNEREIDYGYDEFITETETRPDSYLRDESSISVTVTNVKTFDQKAMREANRSFSQADWEQFKRETPSVVFVDDPAMIATMALAVANATGIASVSLIVQEVNEFIDHIKPPADIQTIIMFVILALLILMLAYMLIRRMQPAEEEEEIEPELSVEDLLVSTQLEEAKDEEAKLLEEIDYSKESEVKKQIEKFVNEKPEAVAQLLRNWLNSEEWA
ncbi:MAG: hypothetical protein FWE82_09635 [Defluviitaleaceae bacterium]|nr:hypothetical protein [Defluviitaleaceae bacterium]